MPGTQRTPPDLPVSSRPEPPTLSRSLALALGVLVLMHLGHPHTWAWGPGLWVAPAGIGLALAAWLGPWGILLVAIHTLLLAFQSYWLGTPRTTFGLPVGALGLALDVALPTLEAAAGWWFFRRILPRTTWTRLSVSQVFADPRCATLFVVLVPGLFVGVLALAAAGVARVHGLPDDSFWPTVGTIWLSRALGVMIVTPPLLLVFTPWLLRSGIVAPRTAMPTTTEPAPPDVRSRVLPGEPPPELRGGDWVEVIGLSLATGVFESLLVLSYSPGDQGAWQIWGVPLLLVIWACFRQGPAGGLLVASGSALMPLALSALDPSPDRMPWFILQGHLLAQCTTALLVSSSAAWIRASESGYRRIVGHIPVLLYSARTSPRPQRTPSDEPGRPGGDPAARLSGSGLRSLFSWVEVTFVSPASWDLLGCSPGELLGSYEAWLRRVHPSDREVVVASLAQLTRQREPVTCEYRLDPEAVARKDGEQLAGPAPTTPDREPRDRWVRDMLAPHFGPDGRLDGWDGVLTEITEQRLLADDLRRTTSMFHALVSNLPAGVFFVQGAGGGPILVNVRARQLLGRREDTAARPEHLTKVYHLHKPDGTPYPAEDLPVWLALRHGLTSMRDDIVVHRPDGRRVPLVTWAAPIDLVGKGQPDAAVWVLEDLSLLRQAEAALRESESRLRTVIQTMAEGLVLQDANGSILESNPSACQILGLTAEQLKGRSSLDPDWNCIREDGSPFPGDEHPSMVSLRTGQPVRNVVVGIPRSASQADGSRPPVTWIIVNSLPLPASGTRSGGPRVVTTFADITAHLRTLRGLRASEERYRGLVETLPLALVQLDLGLRPVYANPATERLTGFAADDLTNDPESAQSWKNVFAEADRSAVEALLRQALNGETGRCEARFRTRAGEDKVGFLLAQPREDSSGDRVGATLLLMDVTRERQLEAELQRSQRLELVGRLASGIAHDFNNVLTAILALVHLARERLPADHPVHSDLNAINEASEQACNLAAQMLAFGRSRRGAAKPSIGDVNRVARRTLDLLRSTLPKTIHIETALSPDPLPVPVDDTQLQQVMMNLCLNARDAMPRGGRLIVHTFRDESEGKSWAKLSVEDTGLGMPEQVRGRVFDVFFTTKETGTGLGLAVVQQIAEGHGGRVEVWSEQGKGSRFEVWLPLTVSA